MSDSRVKPRRYDNRGRVEQARRVRLRVIEVAHEALLAQGYAATTIAAVAAAAEVSPETVYKRFGGKAGLLKAVYDVRLAGDDEPVPIAERPAVRAMAAETDPRRTVERYAALARELGARIGPLAAVLLDARGTDTDIDAFLATIDAERLVGATAFVEGLVAKGGLRPGLDLEQARDVVWVIISPELYVLLVHRRGWPLAAYESWLADALAAALLP